LHPELNITFHRAFDEVKCMEEAYITLTKYKKNVKRILTSAGAVGCIKGKENLKKLVLLSKEKMGPFIMPGAEDLGPETIKEVHETVGAKYYHVGPTVRINSSYSNNFDPEKINAIKSVVNTNI